MRKKKYAGAPVDSSSACISRNKTGLKPSCIHSIQGIENCNTSSRRSVILGVFDTHSQQQTTVKKGPANQLLWHQRRALIAYWYITPAEKTLVLWVSASSSWKHETNIRHEQETCRNKHAVSEFSTSHSLQVEGACPPPALIFAAPLCY